LLLPAKRYFRLRGTEGWVEGVAERAAENGLNIPRWFEVGGMRQIFKKLAGTF
jgi:hypothetical protein